MDQEKYKVIRRSIRNETCYRLHVAQDRQKNSITKYKNIKNK